MLSKPTIEALEEAGLRGSIRIIVDGTPLPADLADAYTPDAALSLTGT
jgi:methanogenic corrinoid protein MtbC1